MPPKAPEKMLVADLKEELKKRGLPIKGKKDELLARYLEALENDAENNTSSTEKEETQAGNVDVKELETDTAANIEAESEDQTQANANEQSKVKEPNTQPEQSVPVSQEEPIATYETVTTKEASIESHQPIETSQAQAKQEPKTKTPPEAQPKPEKIKSAANKQTAEVATESTMATDAEQGSKRKRTEELNAKEPVFEKRPKAETEQPVSQSESQDMESEVSTQGSAVCIKNFSRPLKIKDLETLINSCGSVQRYWVDRIKTHCYVIYSIVDGAGAAMKDINGLDFQKNGKSLEVVELTPTQASDLINLESAAENANRLFDWKNAIDDVLHNRISASDADTAPIVPSRRSLSTAAIAQYLQPSPSQDDGDIAFSRTSVVEDAGKSLDDLFLKTKTEPYLYYLPVSEEAAQKRLENLASERLL